MEQRNEKLQYMQNIMYVQNEWTVYTNYVEDYSTYQMY